MAEEITEETFVKLVSLAALELSSKESEYLRSQLNKQLRSVHELEAIPLSDDVPLARHGVPYPTEISPKLRMDAVNVFPQAVEIVEQAPQTSENYFIVPETRHTTLE